MFTTAAIIAVMSVTRSPLGPRGKAESSDPPSSVEVDSIVVVSDVGAGPGAGGLAVVGAGPGEGPAVGPGAGGPGLAVGEGGGATVAGLLLVMHSPQHSFLSLASLLCLLDAVSVVLAAHPLQHLSKSSTASGSFTSSQVYVLRASHMGFQSVSPAVGAELGVLSVC